MGFAVSSPFRVVVPGGRPLRQPRWLPLQTQANLSDAQLEIAREYGFDHWMADPSLFLSIGKRFHFRQLPNIRHKSSEQRRSVVSSPDESKG